jgi:hypothetical protein
MSWYSHRNMLWFAVLAQEEDAIESVSAVGDTSLEPLVEHGLGRGDHENPFFFIANGGTTAFLLACHQHARLDGNAVNISVATCQSSQHAWSGSRTIRLQAASAARLGEGGEPLSLQGEAYRHNTATKTQLERKNELQRWRQQ